MAYIHTLKSKGSMGMYMVLNHNYFAIEVKWPVLSLRCAPGHGPEQCGSQSGYQGLPSAFNTGFFVLSL